MEMITIEKTENGELIGMDYNRFAQKYIEVLEELTGLYSEAEEVTFDGTPIPTELANEIFRNEVLKNSLTQTGEKIYNKSRKELYKDGWDFWFQEDFKIRDL